MENGEEAFDVGKVESCGGLIENEEGVDEAAFITEELAEFQSLGFPAGKSIEWLT